MAGGYKKIHKHPNENTQGFNKNPENINRSGRPKKTLTKFKDAGFTKSETIDAFSIVAGMTEAEIHDLIDDPEVTVLEKTVAQAFLKAGSKGRYGLVKDIVEMFADKPKINQEITGDTTIIIDYGED